MVMRLLFIPIAALFAMGLSSCKKKPADLKAAAEAKWRAEQKQKAIKNYQEIVKKYPDSQFAAQAQERLRSLGPPATPAKK